MAYSALQSMVSNKCWYTYNDWMQTGEQANWCRETRESQKAGRIQFFIKPWGCFEVINASALKLESSLVYITPTTIRKHHVNATESQIWCRMLDVCKSNSWFRISTAMALWFVDPESKLSLIFSYILDATCNWRIRVSFVLSIFNWQSKIKKLKSEGLFCFSFFNLTQKTNKCLV